MVTVSQQDSRQVMVQVPPGPLEKVLQAPPDQLHRSSGLKSVRVSLGVDFDLLKSLKNPRKLLLSFNAHQDQKEELQSL